MYTCRQLIFTRASDALCSLNLTPSFRTYFFSSSSSATQMIHREAETSLDRRSSMAQSASHVGLIVRPRSTFIDKARWCHRLLVLYFLCANPVCLSSFYRSSHYKKSLALLLPGIALCVERRDSQVSIHA